MPIDSFAAGTTAKLTAAITVVIGALIIVHPLGAPEGAPVSGALAPAEGPLSGVVVAAFINGLSGRAFAKVKLLAPGLANDGRVVLVDAAAVMEQLT